MWAISSSQTFLLRAATHDAFLKSIGKVSKKPSFISKDEG
jgi:hypothetical protein